MSGFSIKKKTIEKFEIREGHGWATIVLDEDTGEVMIQSDYIDGGYIWGSRGGQTVKQFLTGLNYDYFMGKILGRRETLDQEATEKALLKALDERSDDEHDDIPLSVHTGTRAAIQSACRGLGSAESIMHELADAGVCGDEGILGDGVEHMFVFDYPPQARTFWEEIWEPFVEYLKESELSGEGRA